jgi:hypothetical protein
VELFDWDGIDLFNLVTFTLRLAFYARRVEVTVRPKESKKRPLRSAHPRLEPLHYE